MRYYLREWIQKISNNTSLSRKFIYSTILIIVIPSILLAFAYYFYFQDIIEDEIGSSYEKVVDQYIANIQYKLDLYRNMEDAISVNGTVQEVLSRQDEINPIEIMDISVKFGKEVKNLFLGKNAEGVYSIALFALNEKFPSDGAFLRNVKDVKDDDWYRYVTSHHEVHNYFFHIPPGSDFRVISLIRPINSMNGGSFTQQLGLVKISLYASQIFKLPDGMPRDNGMELFILDSDGKLMFRDTSQYTDSKAFDSINKSFAGDRSNGILKDGKSRKIFINKLIQPYGWRVVVLFPYDEVDSKINAIGFFIFMIVVAMLLISIVLTIVFSKIFTKRIHLLIGKMKRLEAGELQITDVIEGNDEAGMLDRQFNSMVHRLKGLISENYIQRLEKREAELNALQLQINPHFLYNTLESISAIAAINKCFDICNICQKLGDMFRYNINTKRNEFVNLKDEINHIKNYIAIQEVRFEGRFEVRYDIPSELDKCKILKFILQPIVENALNHGLEGKEEKSCLTISAHTQEGTLNLLVEDDGIGMLPEKVEQLNDQINEIDSSTIEQVKRSIGLKNVNARIKLVNGNVYGITVESRWNQGTRVRITLPDIRESKGDEDV